MKIKFRKHLIFVALWIFQNFEKTYIHFLLLIFLMEYKDPFIIYCLYRTESGHQQLWDTGLVSSWSGLFAAAVTYCVSNHGGSIPIKSTPGVPSLARAMACNLSGAIVFNHHHNRCRLIVLWTNVSKYNQNANTSIWENVFEDAVCKMATSCYRSQCVSKLDRS